MEPLKKTSFIVNSVRDRAGFEDWDAPFEKMEVRVKSNKTNFLRKEGHLCQVVILTRIQIQHLNRFFKRCSGYRETDETFQSLVEFRNHDP
jgi:hypothetical protein